MRPLSYLHERAVAHLYDALHGDFICGEQYPNHQHAAPDGVMVRLSPDGPLSGNLLDGVTSVKIPDPEWDQVGGIVPDLMLYGPDHESRPVRIIEVVVSNPPGDAKQEKLDTLRRRGVDVVEVKVATEDDVINMCWQRSTPTYAARRRRSTQASNFFRPVHGAHQHDSFVMELIAGLTRCSPVYRRELVDVLKGLESLDSLAPINPDNPLKQKLQR